MFSLINEHINRCVDFTEAEMQRFNELLVVKQIPKKALMLQEGEVCNFEAYINKGCIRTYYVSANEEEKTTAFYTEMEALTPPCVISKTPSEYYVSCIEDSILTVSNSDMEVEINRKFPKFETMCRILSEELLAKQRIDFDEFKTSSPEQRYLNLLQKRPDLIQRVPQHQLASYLGIKPQSLSRLRARIVEKKS